MDKSADLTFNVSATEVQNNTSNIRFSTQDEGTAKLTFILFKDGVELPLNAVTGKLAMRMADGSKFTDAVTIVDKLNGIAEYWLTTEQLKHYGRVNAELYLNYDNNQKMSVHRFSFTIEQALIDADIAVDTEFYVDDFYTMKEAIETIAAETQSTVDLTKEKADEIISLIAENDVAKKSELQVTNEQLATTNNELLNRTTYDYVDMVISNVVTGAPKGTFLSFDSLQNTYPNGAAGYYLVLDNNEQASHIYEWSGSEWVDVGVFGGTGLAAFMTVQDEPWEVI